MAMRIAELVAKKISDHVIRAQQLVEAKRRTDVRTINVAQPTESGMYHCS